VGVIMVRVVRMIVGGRMIGMMRVAMRPKSAAMVLDVPVRMPMSIGLSRADLVFLQQNFGLTASTYAAHPAISVLIRSSPQPIRESAPTGPAARPG
jgi:hypothetical protein